MHPITIEKHELHSAWPIYNQSDVHAGENGLIRAKIHRSASCFAPGDRVKVKIIVFSNRVEPAKLKSVAFSIKQTVTFHGVKNSRLNLTSNSAANENKPASQHVETITSKAKQVGKKLYKGDSFNYDLECVIPKTHSLMTISTAKHIEVSYTMRVYVDISKAPIVIDHIPMLMTTFNRGESTNLIRKIGFVQGLSERDLVIDDDDDDDNYDTTSQIVSRTASQRPSASRSGSLGGSSVGPGYYDNLRRRDTVMTAYSGPGMAGRGVPGQIFEYGSYGGASEYYPDARAGAHPRSAFAGPPVKGAEGATLSATERAALAHYHTATAGDAFTLVVDYSTFATASGLGTPPVAPRSQFLSIAEETRQRNNLSRNSVSSREQLGQAEEEKERLFQRAREQAERSQRRADERRANATSQRLSLQTPPVSILQHPPPAAANTMTEAEAEKQRLYERARREAETYQRGYQHGVTFPEEAELRAGSTLTSPQGRHHQETRRDSDLYWLDSPINDPKENRGILASSRQSSSPFNLASSSNHPAAANSSSSAFLFAEEEKKRLYEQAKAETDSHLQAQRGQASGSSASGCNQVPLQQFAATNSSLPSAASEKAQMARFQAAVDAVERNQRKSEPVFNIAQDRQRPQSSYAAPPTFTAVTPNPASTLSEKEQIKLYYEAKDRQAQAERGTAATSSSTPLRHSMGSNMASPRPQYANNYQNGNNTGWQAGQSSTLPPGSTFPNQRRLNNGNGHSASPSLPALSTLNLNNGRNVGPLPHSAVTTWLPNVASSQWTDDDFATINSPSANSAIPPPIPPKTPLSPR